MCAHLQYTYDVIVLQFRGFVFLKSKLLPLLGPEELPFVSGESTWSSSDRVALTVRGGILGFVTLLSVIAILVVVANDIFIKKATIG